MNKIIIIGGSNYNELGLVRCFGANGIKPYGILIGVGREIKHASVIYSKYWSQVDIVGSKENALRLLQSKYSGETEKPILITSCDDVMQYLDAHYSGLSDNFILSSFGGKTDGINDFASKFKQAELAKKIGFPMLNTDLIEFDVYDQVERFEKVSNYPLLLKPVKGGEGSKNDISVVNDRSELERAICQLKKKQYSRILVQPYLKSRTEYLITGAISPDNDFVSYTMLEGIRQWPTVYGISSFSKLTNELTCNQYATNLLQALVAAGYDGLIDIEIFKTQDGRFFVNEFNWRSSGRNWVSLSNGIYSSVWWCLNKAGVNIEANCLVNHAVGYAMYEFQDINHVLQGNIKFGSWLKDYRKTRAFSARSTKDVIPYLIELAWFVKRILTWLRNRKK